MAKRRIVVGLNVQDRDVGGFVEDARATVARMVSLPAGYYIGWSGRWENQARARTRVQVVIPIVLAIIFTCNHCPTAQYYEPRIKQIVTDYRNKGVALVAISPNDPASVRLDELGWADMGDSFEEMKLRAKDRDYNFPYLFEGDAKGVARAYGPVATPHAFVFDAQRKLRYAGAIDDSERIQHVQKRYLRDAIDSLLAGNDNGGAATFSQIRYAITRTAEYVTRVIQYTPSPDSTYDLIISCPHPPPEDYDLCETARVIPGLPYYNEGSTQGQTNQGGTPAPDVFYSFYNPVTGNYTIIVCSDLFDARVQILGRCVGDYWDDANEGCNLGALLNTYNLAPGQYWIMVEGTTANEIGNFSIEVTAQLPECPPPESVTLSTVGGYPFLDWQELSGPYYYIVWQSNTSNGAFEHLGTTFVTYFIDSTGYSNARRFYQVTSVCPW